MSDTVNAPPPDQNNGMVNQPQQPTTFWNGDRTGGPDRSQNTVKQSDPVTNAKRNAIYIGNGWNGKDVWGNPLQKLDLHDPGIAAATIGAGGSGAMMGADPTGSAWWNQFSQNKGMLMADGGDPGEYSSRWDRFPKSDNIADHRADEPAGRTVGRNAVADVTDSLRQIGDLYNPKGSGEEPEGVKYKYSNDKMARDAGLDDMHAAVAKAFKWGMNQFGVGQGGEQDQQFADGGAVLNFAGGGLMPLIRPSPTPQPIPQPYKPAVPKYPMAPTRPAVGPTPAPTPQPRPVIHAFDSGGEVESTDALDALARNNMSYSETRQPGAGPTGGTLVNQRWMATGDEPSQPMSGQDRNAIQGGTGDRPLPSGGDQPQQQPAIPGMGDQSEWKNGGVRSLLGYLQGKGADPAKAKQYEQKVDPTGEMPDGQRKMAAIHAATEAGGPQEGFAVGQTYRVHHDAYKAGAAYAIAQGDLKKAAQYATQAGDNVPNGEDVRFTATKDGFHVELNGKSKLMSPEELYKFLRSPASQFDQQVFGDGGFNKLTETAKPAKAGATAPQAAPPEVSSGGSGINIFRAGRGGGTLQVVGGAPPVPKRWSDMGVTQGQWEASLEQPMNEQARAKFLMDAVQQGRENDINTQKAENPLLVQQERNKGAEIRANGQVLGQYLRAQGTIGREQAHGAWALQKAILDNKTRLEAAGLGQQGRIASAVIANSIGLTTDELGKRLDALGINLSQLIGQPTSAPAPAQAPAPRPQGQAPAPTQGKGTATLNGKTLYRHSDGKYYPTPE